ncbi:MAG: hypothetical protein AABW65_02355 [Nanoarchaeota archaeon]
MQRENRKKEQHENINYSHTDKLQEKIIENLIELQKVNTNLAEKFDNLSTQINNLLGLFEMTARSFAQNPANLTSDKDKEFLDKINKLLEQNKTIAKGLTIMEEKIRERAYGIPTRAVREDEENYSPASISKPLPKF